MPNVLPRVMPHAKIEPRVAEGARRRAREHQPLSCLGLAGAGRRRQVGLVYDGRRERQGDLPDPESPGSTRPPAATGLQRPRTRTTPHPPHPCRMIPPPMMGRGSRHSGNASTRSRRSRSCGCSGCVAPSPRTTLLARRGLAPPPLSACRRRPQPAGRRQRPLRQLPTPAPAAIATVDD